MKKFIVIIFILINSILHSQTTINLIKKGEVIELNTPLYQGSRVVGKIDTMYFSNNDIMLPEVEVTIYEKISKIRIERIVRCSIYHLIEESTSLVIIIKND
jgi:hypothetical protein